MQLRATFKALYTIIFYDDRKTVEQLIREYDSVMPPLQSVLRKIDKADYMSFSSEIC